MSASVKSLLVVCALCFVLVSTGQGNAEVATCDAVVNMAEVHHGPDISVTFTSSRGDHKYCRFSINGFVAVADAPQDFVNGAAKAYDQWQQMAKAQKADKEAIMLLPYLLLAADEKFEAKELEQVSAIIGEVSGDLWDCYDQFFAGEEVAKELAAGRVACKNEGKRLRTALTTGDLVRVVYIYRA